MKKLFILFSIFCLMVGFSTYSMATMGTEALTIKGDVRVEYDNWLSRDKPAAARTERLYFERAMLNFTYDPGTATTATVILRADGDSYAATDRVDFYVYNGYVKHALMDNKLNFTLGKFNIHIPTVYGICGPNTYSYGYFTKEKKNGAMATFKAMPELAINLAIIDYNQADTADSRPYDLYLNASYKAMDALNLFLGLKSHPATDVSNGDNVNDMEITFTAKYKEGKLQATLEYYQEMLDSVDDADKMVINLGASYQATDQIKPYLAIESIDDGVDDSGAELNIIAGAHYSVTENLTYALELDYTMDEDSDVDDMTKIGLRARYTF